MTKSDIIMQRDDINEGYYNRQAYALHRLRELIKGVRPEGCLISNKVSTSKKIRTIRRLNRVVELLQKAIDNNNWIAKMRILEMDNEQ